MNQDGHLPRPVQKKKMGIYLSKNKIAGTKGKQVDAGRRRNEDGYLPRPVQKKKMGIYVFKTKIGR